LLEEISGPAARVPSLALRDDTRHVLVIVVRGVQHVGKKLLLTPAMSADVRILVNETHVVFVNETYL
jgi:hypothetical protein